MNFSQRLQKARAEIGLTQAQISAMSNIKQQMISKLEKGKAQGTVDIFPLADALGVEARWLATGEGPEKKVVSLKSGKANTGKEAQGVSVPLRIQVEDREELRLLLTVKEVPKEKRPALLAYVELLLNNDKNGSNVYSFLRPPSKKPPKPKK